MASILPVPARAAKPDAPFRHAREPHDRPGDRRRQRHDQRIPIFHVRELMRQNTLELLFAHQLQESGGHRHRRMPRAASCRKRVGRLGGNPVQLGHRQSAARGNLPHDAIDLRGFGFAERLRSVHGQNDLVAEPVDHEIHHQGDDEGDSRPLRSPNHMPEEHQQHGQQREQEPRLQHIHVLLLIGRSR